MNYDSNININININSGEHISRKALELLAHDIQSILWWEADTEKFNVDKEWDSAADFLEMIADAAERAGLKPENRNSV